MANPHLFMNSCIFIVSFMHLNAISQTSSDFCCRPGLSSPVARLLTPCASKARYAGARALPGWVLAMVIDVVTECRRSNVVVFFLPSGDLTWLLEMAIYSGFSHQTWWFSIDMLDYQRVRENQWLLRRMIESSLVHGIDSEWWDLPSIRRSSNETHSCELLPHMSADMALLTEIQFLVDEDLSFLETVSAEMRVIDRLALRRNWQRAILVGLDRQHWESRCWEGNAQVGPWCTTMN